MLPTFAASNAVEVAREVAQKVPETLSDTAKLIHTTLVAAAVETARRRGYSPNTTHVTLHCPLEQVARACGMSRQTLWRHLPALKELGVLDYRAHKGAFFGSTRNTGTLWQVRLDPVRGSRARLSYDDLRHKWRDLEGDYRRYRTSFRALKHTKELSANTVFDLERILQWTLPPGTQLDPASHVCNTAKRASIESVLDVVSVQKVDRNRMVGLAAEALAQALGDRNSVGWYQRLLWQLLRRFDATGEDYSYSVYLAAQRARVDRSEGFARRAGALFHSRLKTAEWFGEMMSGPPTKVGTKPLSA